MIQASYDHTPVAITMPYTTESCSLEYIPQFMVNALPTTMVSNRWWMNFPPTPTSSLHGSPSTPSSMTRSPMNASTASPILANSPVTVPTMLSSTIEPHDILPNEEALKIYTEAIKAPEKWNIASASSPASSDTKLFNLGYGLRIDSPWKQLSPSSSNSSSPSTRMHSLPIPQPLYPQISTHIIPRAIPVSDDRIAGVSAVKQEKEERNSRFTKMVDADSTIEPEERKRILHLNAEQNRRFALKDGFDKLLNMLPNVYANGTKPTNAVILGRTAQRIRELKDNMQRDDAKVMELKQHVQRLNDKIMTLQASLPSSSKMENNVSHKVQLEHFIERYTKERTRQDYRFWLMKKLLQPLIENLVERFSEIEDSNVDSLLALTSDWLRTNWQPSKLRPYASTLLVYLATQATMLTNPSGLQEHIQREINRQ